MGNDFLLLQGLRAGYRAMIEALDGDSSTSHVYLRPFLSHTYSDFSWFEPETSWGSQKP